MKGWRLSWCCIVMKWLMVKHSCLSLKWGCSYKGSEVSWICSPLYWGKAGSVPSGQQINQSVCKDSSRLGSGGLGIQTREVKAQRAQYIIDHAWQINRRLSVPIYWGNNEAIKSGIPNLRVFLFEAWLLVTGTWPRLANKLSVVTLPVLPQGKNLAWT